MPMEFPLVGLGEPCDSWFPLQVCCLLCQHGCCRMLIYLSFSVTASPPCLYHIPSIQLKAWHIGEQKIVFKKLDAILNSLILVLAHCQTSRKQPRRWIPVEVYLAPKPCAFGCQGLYRASTLTTKGPHSGSYSDPSSTLCSKIPPTLLLFSMPHSSLQ